jgi:hypothetical protein
LRPTGYEDYSYTPYPIGDYVVECVDPQFLDWGHYIPQKILITAYKNDGSGDSIGGVTVTYSTGDQSGGDVCGPINDLVGGLLPLVLDDPVAALAGTAMTVTCDLIDG